MANGQQFGFHATFEAINATQAEIRDQIGSLGRVLERVEGAMPDAEIASGCLTRIAFASETAAREAALGLQQNAIGRERMLELAAGTVVLAERGLEALVAVADRTERALNVLTYETARIAVAAEILVRWMELRDDAERSDPEDVPASSAPVPETRAGGPENRTGHQQGGAGRRDRNKKK